MPRVLIKIIVIIIIIIIILLFFNVYSERERAGEGWGESETERERERQRERERENPKQIHAATAEPNKGLDLMNGEIKSQMLNQLSHPGAPNNPFKVLTLCQALF